MTRCLGQMFFCGFPYVTYREFYDTLRNLGSTPLSVCCEVRGLPALAKPPRFLGIRVIFAFFWVLLVGGAWRTSCRGETLGFVI